MFFSAQLANAAAIIRVGAISKRECVFIPKTRRVLNFLNVLQRAHIIRGYTIQSCCGKHAICRVTLVLDSNCAAAAKIRIIQTTGKKTSMSLKALRSHVRLCGATLIISTSAGLLLSTEACALGVSGAVVACISL